MKPYPLQGYNKPPLIKLRKNTKVALELH